MMRLQWVQQMLVHQIPGVLVRRIPGVLPLKLEVGNWKSLLLHKKEEGRKALSVFAEGEE